MMEYIFEPLLKVAQNSYKVRENIISVVLYPGHLLSMFFGSLFLLLLACFNYMNIAIVSAARRFKEIGVRKVIGSNKINLITQFLGENLLLCCIALFIGITLAELIFAPGFHNFFHVFNFKVDLLGNPGLLVFLLVLLLVIGLGGRSSLIPLAWAFIKIVYSMNTIRLWQGPPKVLPPLL